MTSGPGEGGGEGVGDVRDGGTGLWRKLRTNDRPSGIRHDILPAAIVFMAN